MDLATVMPEGTHRSHLLAAADDHTRLAVDLAAEAGGATGAGFVQLSAVRLSRLRRVNEDRLPPIERVLQDACRLGDYALLAQGFTTLGDELLARGRREAALAHYRDAIGILDGSEMGALEVWPRSALHRAREANDADASEI